MKKSKIFPLTLMLALVACSSLPLTAPATQANLVTSLAVNLDGDIQIPPQIAAKLASDLSIQDQAVDAFVQTESERLAAKLQTAANVPEEKALQQLLQAKSPHSSPSSSYPLHTNPQLQPNTAEVFVDAEEIYPMVFETLAQAKQRIQVDLFVMGGEIGMRLARQLVERHKTGIEVLIMTDPGLGYVGPTKKQVAQVVRYLKAEGLGFKTYPLHHIPTPPGLLANLTQLDHNKLIVVDNQTLIMGGMNFFDMALPNRDTMFRIQGPLVQEASQMMWLDWSLPPKRLTAFAVKAGGEVAQMRLTKTDAFERSTKERILANIRQAQKSIYIEMFEMSEPEITQELIQAHQRGVDVRVLLDQKNGNEKYTGLIPIPNNMPNVWPIREFLKQKLPVRWFKPYRSNQELHRKVLVFDERVVIAGSTNLTTQALNTFRETGFELVGAAVPQRLLAVFKEDWEQHSIPIASLTLKQKLYARMVEYLDKRYMGWW